VPRPTLPSNPHIAANRNQQIMLFQHLPNRRTLPHKRPRIQPMRARKPRLRTNRLIVHFCANRLGKLDNLFDRVGLGDCVAGHDDGVLGLGDQFTGLRDGVCVSAEELRNSCRFQQIQVLGRRHQHISG
jgi:hypothetical protein